MIGALKRVNREQRKLALSLGTNFATRVPGALGILFFLPLLHKQLGTDDYSLLLASIALGTATTFLFGGFSLVGRRLIGEAHSVHDEQAEADGFVSLLTTNALALCLSLVAIGIYAHLRGEGEQALIASTIPALVAFFNTFDNIRAAYNEHYVTATLQFVLQLSIYAAGIAFTVMQRNLALAAFVLQGHLLLASIIAVSLLLRQRGYLLRGRPRHAWQIARQGAMLAMADGFLMATLAMAVVWLQASADAGRSAWFATIVRLFQTFLVPVVLLLMPLSSYVRLLWNGKTLAQQRRITALTLMMGTAYGIAVGFGLVIVSNLYIARVLHIAAPGEWWYTLPIFALFAAITIYKSYSSIAYLVLDVSHLSSWTSMSVGVAVVSGLAVSIFARPFTAIGGYAGTAAVLLLAVLFWNVARFMLAKDPAGLPAKASAPA